MDAILDQRVLWYYVPVICDIWERLMQSRNHGTAFLTVGLSAPQGCGKTTLSTVIVSVLEKMGINAAASSIDDFYLTADAQRDLAETTKNPLLQSRCLPGTHDVSLCLTTLRKLRQLRLQPNTQFSNFVSIPIYDKSLNNGEGNRLPASSWRVLTSPPEVLIFEGWLLGFTHFPASLANKFFSPKSTPKVQKSGAEVEATASEDPNLPFMLEVNSFLSHYQEIWKEMDYLLMIKPLAEEKKIVPIWREQQEEELRKRTGKACLSPEALFAFVSRCFPAYEYYATRLHAYLLAHTARGGLLPESLPNLCSHSVASLARGDGPAKDGEWIARVHTLFLNHPAEQSGGISTALTPTNSVNIQQNTIHNQTKIEVLHSENPENVIITNGFNNNINKTPINDNINHTMNNNNLLKPPQPQSTLPQHLSSDSAPLPPPPTPKFPICALCPSSSCALAIPSLSEFAASPLSQMASEGRFKIIYLDAYRRPVTWRAPNVQPCMIAPRRLVSQSVSAVNLVCAPSHTSIQRHIRDVHDFPHNNSDESPSLVGDISFSSSSSSSCSSPVVTRPVHPAPAWASNSSSHHQNLPNLPGENVKLSSSGDLAQKLMWLQRETEDEEEAVGTV
eukprot:GDKK01062790.1.p1 GENE.GDKK01062790.1~~GDKK01062790.1.p1  ORF type:complete len:666 (+),score=138.92 GDKK01062790.1:145-1998(+)